MPKQFTVIHSKLITELASQYIFRLVNPYTAQSMSVGSKQFPAGPRPGGTESHQQHFITLLFAVNARCISSLALTSLASSSRSDIVIPATTSELVGTTGAVGVDVPQSTTSGDDKMKPAVTHARPVPKVIVASRLFAPPH